MTLNSLLDKIELELVAKAQKSKKAKKYLKEWRAKFGTGVIAPAKQK